MKRVIVVFQRLALKVVAHSWLLPDRLRPALLRRCGLTVGEGVSILSGIRLAAAEVGIGDGSFINYDCVIDALWGSVTIGERVFLAPQVTIMTASHQVGSTTQRAGDAIHGPVHIGDGAWVGLRSTILPNVTVGAGCIIAAGAVVTADCEANGLYAGIPARRVRDLPTDATGLPVSEAPAIA